MIKIFGTPLGLVVTHLTILIAAFGLTFATARMYPGTETPISGGCLIEDCAAGIHRAGVPFRAFEVVRYEGLNCGRDDQDKCTSSSLLPWGFLANFLSYSTLLILVIDGTIKLQKR